MRLRVADLIPLAVLAGAALSASLSPGVAPAGPTPDRAATVAADQLVYATDEGGSARVQVTVTTRSGAPLRAAVTVGYSTGAGTATAGADYLPAAGTLTFAAGTRSGITQTFLVRTTRDRAAEATETVPVRLACATTGVRVDPHEPTVLIYADGRR
jgi:beta-glucosidase